MIRDMGFGPLMRVRTAGNCVVTKTGEVKTCTNHIMRMTVALAEFDLQKRLGCGDDSTSSRA